MSLHYADEKALASGEAKRLVLHHFFDLAKSHDLAAKTLTGEVDLIPQGGFTWEDLARLHRAQASASASIPLHHHLATNHMLLLSFHSRHHHQPYVSPRIGR